MAIEKEELKMEYHLQEAEFSFLMCLSVLRVHISTKRGGGLSDRISECASTARQTRGSVGARDNNDYIGGAHQQVGQNGRAQHRLHRVALLITS